MVNLALQPSQYLGRSGGSRPYCRKRASNHSCSPHFCTVHRGYLHRQPGPGLCRPSQLTCALDWAPCNDRRQGLLRPLCDPLPNRCPSLLEAGQVVCCPETHLAHDRCNEVSCDESVLHPVFRGRQCWLWKGQSHLFHWQTGDPSLRCSLP